MIKEKITEYAYEHVPFYKDLAHSLPPLPDLKYIELTGERITGEAKSAIADFFRCKVADQYGCYESNSIAYECPYGGLHVMTENVYVETVGKNEDSRRYLCS